MPAKTVEELRTRLRGEIIQPSDAAYESARKVYNGMIDKRPGCIVRCTDVADVIQLCSLPGTRTCSSRFAAVATMAGLGICDDGLVIDLSRMRGSACRSRRPHRASGRRLHLG